MRKGLAQGQATTHFDSAALKKLERQGYKYVQIDGLTVDKHYDYIEPHFMVLVPIKELPSEQDKKGIYEPIGSEILRQWAAERDDHFEFVIATPN
jgi:hypothetical protein